MKGGDCLPMILLKMGQNYSREDLEPVGCWQNVGEYSSSINKLETPSNTIYAQ